MGTHCESFNSAIFMFFIKHERFEEFYLFSIHVAFYAGFVSYYTKHIICNLVMKTLVRWSKLQQVGRHKLSRRIYIIYLFIQHKLRD